MTTFPRRPIAYVRLPAKSLGACEQFCLEAMGLERAAAGDGFVAFRADERAQSVMFSTEEPEAAIGLEVADEQALEDAAARLLSRGMAWRRLHVDECQRRCIRSGLVVHDVSGVRIELVTGPQVNARRFYPATDAGVAGLLTIGLRARRIDDDLSFWVEGLGARIGDRVGDIAYLRLDAAHHRIALYPSDRGGLLYVGFAVKSHDDLMRNAYNLQARQVRLVHGPGCETASGRMFIRFIGPDENLFAFEFDEQEDRADIRPRQFEHSATALCCWGSRCQDVKELAA